MIQLIKLMVKKGLVTVSTAQGNLADRQSSVSEKMTDLPHFGIGQKFCK